MTRGSIGLHTCFLAILAPSLVVRAIVISSPNHPVDGRIRLLSINCAFLFTTSALRSILTTTVRSSLASNLDRSKMWPGMYPTLVSCQNSTALQSPQMYQRMPFPPSPTAGCSGVRTSCSSFLQLIVADEHLDHSMLHAHAVRSMRFVRGIRLEKRSRDGDTSCLRTAAQMNLSCNRSPTVLRSWRFCACG